MEERDELKQKITGAINEPRRSPLAEEMVGEIEGSEMKPVLVNPSGGIILVDPYSAKHFEFSPTELPGEYEKEMVDDIATGEPIPERYVRGEWAPIDPDWRASVESGRVERGV